MEEYNFKLNSCRFIIFLCIDRLNNLNFNTLRERLSKCFKE